MKPATALVAALFALAVHTLSQAEPGSSMRQARSEMDKGTWTGTVLYKSRPDAEAAPQAAPVSASGLASASAAASAPAVRKPTFTERLGALLGRGEPLSSQPMDVSKRLDLPSQGTALPTAASGTGASAAGR